MTSNRQSLAGNPLNVHKQNADDLVGQCGQRETLQLRLHHRHINVRTLSFGSAIYRMGLVRACAPLSVVTLGCPPSIGAPALL
jgi:hypothetical protein